MLACVSHLALLLGPLQDPLFDGTLADEAVHSDLLGLTQPVGPVHGLLVYRWVPVAVVEDNLQTKRGAGSACLRCDFRVRFLLSERNVAARGL